MPTAFEDGRFAVFMAMRAAHPEVSDWVLQVFQAAEYQATGGGVPSGVGRVCTDASTEETRPMAQVEEASGRTTSISRSITRSIVMVMWGWLLGRHGGR